MGRGVLLNTLLPTKGSCLKYFFLLWLEYIDRRIVMAYGRYGGGGQSNLRSVDAGQARANAKDADNSRNITIPKVVLPVKKKKKPKTLLGLTIGPAPKSDQEKKIESGATVIATKSGGKIVTTPTMDNKSLIMSKATQQKTKDEYLSSTANLAKAKPAIGQAISGGQSTRLSQLSSKTGGTPTTSTKLSQLASKTGGTPLTATSNVLANKTGSANSKDSGIPKINTTQLQSKTGPTLLRGGNKVLKSGGQFGSLQERTFLKTSTKAGRSIANPSITSSVVKKVKSIFGGSSSGGGLSMPSGTSTPVDDIKTSKFFDSKRPTTTKKPPTINVATSTTPSTTKKPANINMVTKSLPANYTVSSQKKSKPIPFKQTNAGTALFRRVGGKVQARKFSELGQSQTVKGNLVSPIVPKSRLAGSDLNTNILSQNIAKSDAKMNASTYAKEGPEVPVFNVKTPKVPASLIRQLRKANTAELNAYMVPNVLRTYSKAEQKAIKAEFNKRNKNSKSGFPSLLARTVAGVL